MHKDGTECSETLSYKLQTPGNYPEESLQNSEYGESLKSRILLVGCVTMPFSHDVLIAACGKPKAC
jgi:hypothetical protein